MPADAALTAVSAPTSAALRVGESGAFEPTAFDLFAFDIEPSQDLAPTTATLTNAPSPTTATLQAA